MIHDIEFRWKRFGGLYRELEYRVLKVYMESDHSYGGTPGPMEQVYRWSDWRMVDSTTAAGGRDGNG